jgi:hypothetical protein
MKFHTALLAFYDFPTEHWIRIRSSNMIESSFATVRLGPIAPAFSTSGTSRTAGHAGL